MSAPPNYPGRIRTDTTNAFAHHTMRVRVPAIVRQVLDRNPDYDTTIADALGHLANDLEQNAPLPPLMGASPGAQRVRRALAARASETWLHTDWFFAETYAYRQLTERVRYWETRRDPFLPLKRDEYASRAHADAFEYALALRGSPEERLAEHFTAGVFGNRMDLSFAASLERGLDAAAADLLIDERGPAIRQCLTAPGPIHVIADNAGTELTLDMVFCDFALGELRAPVVLHLKTHPTFVSDATIRDVECFLGRDETPLFEPGSHTTRACIARLARALDTGQLVLRSHPYWNGPDSLWDMPNALARQFTGARLVVLKGDANYRRALGDAVWPTDTSFAALTSYFAAPLLALRALKSDPVVGLPRDRAKELDRIEPSWRVNGRRGIASFKPGRPTLAG